MMSVEALWFSSQITLPGRFHVVARQRIMPKNSIVRARIEERIKGEAGAALGRWVLPYPTPSA